jgi:tetratricopeptide (TPR) repeat protein
MTRTSTHPDIALSNENKTILSGRPVRARGNLDARLTQFNTMLDQRRPPLLDDPFAKESIGSIQHFNRGALLLSQYGDLERAAQLCRKAIEICSRRRAITQAWGWEWCAITPFQNLARVQMMEGRRDEPLQVYSSIFEFFVKREPLHIFDLTVYPDDTHRKVAQQFGDDFEQTSPYAYLQTAARVYMVNGNFQELLRFMERLNEENFVRTDGYLLVLNEVYARSYLALNRPAEALQAAGEMLRLFPRGAVAHLLQTQAHELAGDRQQAFTCLEELAARLLHAEKYPWIFGYLCALIFAQLGYLDRATEVSLSALEQCTQAGEEPGKLKVLLHLAWIAGRNHDSSSREKAGQWVRQLVMAASECKYRFEAATAFAEAGALLAEGITSGEVTKENCWERSLKTGLSLKHIGMAKIMQENLAKLQWQRATQTEDYFVFRDPDCDHISNRLAEIFESDETVRLASTAARQ